MIKKNIWCINSSCPSISCCSYHRSQIKGKVNI